MTMRIARLLLSLFLATLAAGALRAADPAPLGPSTSASLRQAVRLEPASTATIESAAPFGQSTPTRLRPVIRPVPSWVETIDTAAEFALSRGVPGLQVSVRLGKTFTFDKAYGVTDIETGTPAETDSQFEIGSITKQFTAAGIMRLVEKSALDVHDPLSDWVPELDTHGYHPTLRHLLAHTSGMPNYTDLLQDFSTPMSEAQMIGYIGDLPWRFEPGTSWEYSNSGYYVLGTVIERVTGSSYVGVLDQDFISPLGLIHTSYCGANPAMRRPGGYIEVEPGTIQPAPDLDISLVFAAGGICSTASDLVRWNRALVSGLAVSPASYDEMSTDARLDNGAPVGYGYGLGVTVHRGRRLITHGGATFGFLSHLAYYPDYDLTVAVLTNLRPYSADYSQSVGLEIAREILSDIDARAAAELATRLRAVNW